MSDSRSHYDCKFWCMSAAVAVSCTRELQGQSGTFNFGISQGSDGDDGANIDVNNSNPFHVVSHSPNMLKSCPTVWSECGIDRCAGMNDSILSVIRD